MDFLRYCVFFFLAAALQGFSLTNAYITSNDNSLNIYDTTGLGNTSVAVLPTGNNPYNVIVTPDGARAYVCNFNMVTSVNVIDTLTNSVIHTFTDMEFPVASETTYAAARPDGKRVYILDFMHGAVDSFITTIDNTVTPPAIIGPAVMVGRTPQMIAITPNGRKAYVPNFNSDDVSVLDLTMDPPGVSTIAAGIGTGPFHIAITPDGTKAYVANYGDTPGSISVIDTATDTVSSVIPIPMYMAYLRNGPQAIAITPDGTKAFVANNESDSYSVIDTATDSLIVPNHFALPVGSLPFYVAVSPDGNDVYFPNFGTDNVSRVSASTNALIANIAAGNGPSFLAVAPDSSKVYVANVSSSDFTIVYPATNTSVNVALGGVSSWVAFSPAVQPVTNLRGSQFRDRFLSQIDLVNIIRWDVPLQDLAVEGFRIYRDAALTDLAGTVPHTINVFEDHNRKKGVVYTYYVVGFNAAGLVSTPVSTQVTP